MTEKRFKEILKSVETSLDPVSDKYAIDNLLLKRKVAEDKANSCSWSGSDSLSYLSTFSQNIYKDSSQTTSGIIKYYFDDLRIKLNDKQCNEIESKIIQQFDIIIENYKKAYYESMGRINSTQESLFNVYHSNVNGIIKHQFSRYRFTLKMKVDKIMFWTKCNTIIALLTLLVAVLSILVHR